MPFEIKNTKDFPYFKDFFKHEAACIVQHSVYNKLVMHVKMSWVRSIKPPPKPRLITHRVSPRERHRTLYARLAFWKIAVRIVRVEEEGGGLTLGDFKTCFLFLHIVLASSATCERQSHAAIPCSSWWGVTKTRISERHLRLHSVYNLHS